MEVKKKNLNNLIKLTNLQNKISIIKWTNDLDIYYKSSKLLILPSFFEGFGNVLIEALNFNLPCIATNNDGPREVLGYGKYGLLIKDNKPSTINQALVNVLNNYNLFKSKAKSGFHNNHTYHIDIIGKHYFMKISSVLK